MENYLNELDRIEFGNLTARQVDELVWRQHDKIKDRIIVTDTGDEIRQSIYNCHCNIFIDSTKVELDQGFYELAINKRRGRLTSQIDTNFCKNKTWLIRLTLN